MKYLKTLCLYIYVMMSCGACFHQEPQGFLLVKAPDSGNSYEVYRVDGDGWQHYSTEKVGFFNVPLSLAAGRYLVLADCSSQDVIIYQNVTSEVESYQLEFKLPQPLDKNDQLLVQCVRHDQTGAHQTLKNQTILHVLGDRELLVGMRSVKVRDNTHDHRVQVHLGGLRVMGREKSLPYFVSPVDPLFSTTMHQGVGSWLYLIPGEYQLMINGTRDVVSVDASQLLTRELASVRFQPPSGIELSDYVKVKGSLAHIEVNGQHDFEFGEAYSVLPGPLKAKIGGHREHTLLNLKAGEETVLKLRSVKVNLECSPWDWSCLGQQEVLLYRRGEDYPFCTGQSDMPILFAGHDVFVGLGGSRNIRYRLKSSDVIDLDAGKLQLIPIPTYRAGQLTELARLAGSSDLYDGYSHDVQPNRAVTMTLIAGRYDLSRFICSGSCYGSGDGERWEQKRSVLVPPRSSVTYEFQYYVREHKYTQARDKYKHFQEKQAKKSHQNVPYVF
ncbi:MAG: hypothetical protein AB8C84_04045 [Oligoflexales bacterium]